MNDIEILKNRIDVLEKIVGQFMGSDTVLFRKGIQIFDGRNIQTGRTTGTMIGTATDQLIGFYGTTPVNQPATIADPASGSTIDTEARTAINTIIDRLQELGLIA